MEEICPPYRLADLLWRRFGSTTQLQKAGPPTLQNVVLFVYVHLETDN
jgi:hypothetical protein